MAKNKTAAEYAAEQKALQDELVALEGKDDWSDDDVARSAAIPEEFEALEVARKAAVERESKLDAVRSAVFAGRTESTTAPRSPELMRKVDPFDGDAATMSRSQVIDHARKAVEIDDYVLADVQKEELERSLRRRSKDFDGAYVARRLLLTENEAYRSAFAKQIIFGANAALSRDESDAVSRFQAFEIERSMNEGTTTAGGFGVPVYIDPSIILTSGAADAPLLRVARIEQITNQVWKGVSSAGMTWSFDSEAVEVSDDSPTLAQPVVTAHMARGFIPYSIEVGMDYPGFAQEMAALLSQGYLDLLAAKTQTGTGTGEPWGIFTAIDQTSASEVTPTTDGSFGAEDVFKVWNALPERFRSRATWDMSVHVESAIRAFGSSGSASAYFTVDLTADGVSRINGRPVVVSDYAPTMASGVPGTTGAQNILVVGDFRHYLVAQRAGMSVEQIPMLFSTTTNLPDGRRGWFAWARVGADSVADNAFRLLQNQ